MCRILSSRLTRDLGAVILMMVAVASVVVLSKAQAMPPDIQTPCNLTDRHASCPEGYCCVRDDFLFTETYCREHGSEGSNCVTHTSQFECPCMSGLVCEPNIHGTHASVFGKCTGDGGSTTTTDVPDGSTTPDQPSTTLDEHGNPVVG